MKRLRLCLGIFVIVLEVVCAASAQRKIGRRMPRALQGGGRSGANRRCGGCGGGIPPSRPPPLPPADCSKCGADQYLASTCTSTADRVCKPCSSLPSCSVDRFRNGCGNDQQGSCALCASCDDGKYRSGCEGSSSGICHDCASCPAGQFLSTCMGTSPGSCLNCPAGSTSPSGSTAQAHCVCSIGYAATANGVCSACNAGEFKEESGSGACNPCIAGKYASQTASTLCLPCPAGTTSPAGSTSATSCVCNAGYISSTDFGGQECNMCGAGKFKATATSCQDCRERSNSPAASESASACKCNAGSYGPVGGTCERCTAGKYSAEIGATAESTCSSCGPGKFATVIGATSESTCTACPERKTSITTANDAANDCLCVGGYYELNGECVKCEGGKYKSVISNAACTNCPADTYNPETGSSISSACIQCPTYSSSPPASNASTFCYCLAGYTPTNSATCTACSAGKYKTMTGVGLCSECAAGTYSGSVAATSSSTCTPCPDGNPALPGSTAASDCVESCAAGKTGTSGSCSPCPLGTYKSFPGTGACTDCSASSTSEAGSSICQCNAGYFLHNNDCQLCQAGTYKFAQGNDLCTLCAAGKALATPGAKAASACVACTPGYFAQQGGSSTCGVCAAGKFSSLGEASSCSLCNAGTFSGNTGGTTCNACPTGRYSDTQAATTCKLCPEGKSLASVGGSTLSACVTCDSGKYSSASVAATSCDNCVAGKYNLESGRTNCDACVVGKWQGVEGSTYCVDCQAGTYSSATAATSVVTCQECIAGKYLATQGNDGQTDCQECDVGTYSSTFGATSCEECGAGTFQTSRGKTHCVSCNVIECPVGQELVGCGTMTSGACSTCSCSLALGLYFSDACGSVPNNCTKCGCKQCTRPSCMAGTYLTACTALSDARCLGCSICAAGQRQEAECTQSSDTKCRECDPSSKPLASDWTESGTCAWRCNVGFAYTESGTSCVKVGPAEILLPAALPFQQGLSSPSLSLELQFAVSKEVFLSQLDNFVNSIARTVDVNTVDVKVVSLRELNTALRRQRSVLDVVTEVRTKDPQNLMSRLTLTLVNKKLSSEGLPQAVGIRVSVVVADTPMKNTLVPTTHTQSAQASSSDQLLIVVLPVVGGIGLLSTVFLLYKYRCQASPQKSLPVGPDGGVESNGHVALEQPRSQVNDTLFQESQPFRKENENNQFTKTVEEKRFGSFNLPAQKLDSPLGAADVPQQSRHGLMTGIVVRVPS